MLAMIMVGWLSAQSETSTAFLLGLLSIDSLLLQSKNIKSSLQFFLPLKYLAYQLVKCSSRTFQGLSTRLDIYNSDLLSYFNCTIFIDLATVFKIYLIADEKKVYFGDISFITNLLDPEINHFERFDVGNIKDKQDAVNVPVVVRSNGIVTCSTSSVPDLHSDRVPILQFQCLLLVLHSDRCRVVNAELLVHVLRQEGTLSHVALPNYQQFYPHLFFPTHSYYINRFHHIPAFKKYTHYSHQFTIKTLKITSSPLPITDNKRSDVETVYERTFSLW